MINSDYLERILLPLGYQLDISQEKPFFWKPITHKDMRSAYAFSLVLITLDEHTVRIEGLNEPRLKKAIREGLIIIGSQEDVDALKEVVFETTLDQIPRMEMILPFFEQQLLAIEQNPVGTEPYKKAIANIILLVEAANDVNS